MKPEIITPNRDIVTPGNVPAQPVAAPSDWSRHAALLVGVAGLAGIASAQDATPATPTTGTPATPTTGADTTMPMSNGGIMHGGIMPVVPAPTDSQAVEGNSAVPSTSKNPNNPALTIPKSGKSAKKSDIDILNFALGLEYLEAEFYARVVAAQGRRAYLNPRVFEAAQRLAADEAAHVTAITDILTRAGATPVTKPTFKFPDAAFYSPVAFLDIATSMEETGVGAYSDAAPKVVSKDVLRFAASVYGIECRHTALIRHLAGRSFAPTDTEIPLSMEEVQRRVAPFIAA